MTQKKINEKKTGEKKDKQKGKVSGREAEGKWEWQPALPRVFLFSPQRLLL
jgi:hypothetical protein